MEFETIREQLFLMTTRIVTISESKKGIATGFFFNYKHKEKNYYFIVTNNHVIKNKDEVLLTFIKGERMPRLGEEITYVVDQVSRYWYSHPKFDLTILPFNPILLDSEKRGEPIAFRSFSQVDIPKEIDLSNLDAIEDIFLIGYPIGLWDSINLLPIVRKGITATPISHNFLNEPRFLIDASVFPGSSGSPIIYFDYDKFTEKRRIVAEGRILFHLLGILEKGFVEKGQGITSIEIPVSVKKGDIKTRINIGSVIKSSILVELIEEFMKEHEIL